MNFPPVSKSHLAGTFGKAEKSDKVQKTTKDIQLRSELINDTVRLKGIIGSLTYYSLITEQDGRSIDELLIPFISKGNLLCYNGNILKFSIFSVRDLPVNRSEAVLLN